jgi:DNA-binding NarL/FixJ family response regulator
MDIHMPDRSGIDILKHLSSGFPTVCVLIVSGLPEEQYARNVLRAGARGYLSKGGSAEEFMRAVRLVLNGRRYISAALAESMAADIEKPPEQNQQPLHTALSAREFQIFRKLAIGAPLGGIAKELSQHLSQPNSRKDDVQVERGRYRVCLAPRLDSVAAPRTRGWRPGHA